MENNKQNNKKKLLFIGIIMNCAGTENSFLSFVNCIDFDQYDVDLILAKNEGLFMELIPKQINVKFMPEYGELFLRFRKRDGFLVTRPKGNMVVLKTKAE